MTTTAKTIAALLVAAAARCQDARQLLMEAQRRAHVASVRYEGVALSSNSAGATSEKHWRFERIGPYGESKILIRFLSPAEVEGVAILILNHRDGPAGAWMWTPASARVRSIAAESRLTRFFGTDFSFEDLEERSVDQYDCTLLGDASLDGAACWQIECRPNRGNASQYTYAHLWLQKDNYVITQLENFQGPTLVRRIVNRDVRKVQGIWTPHQVEISQPVRRTRTLLRLEKLEYNVPLDESTFTVEALTPGPWPPAPGPQP
ncbi:MAG: outer membrane lipoprotein-sorting protein [Bryobacteraceae bacterium]